MGSDTAAIWTAAPLEYLLNTCKVCTLEKVFFSNTQNPKTVKILTADDKHYLLNRDYLRQPKQIPLPQKQKIFSQFFLAFLKSILNFKDLPKKDDCHSWYISGNTGSKNNGSINI